MSNDNIIQFPKDRMVDGHSLLPTNEEELVKSISIHRMMLVDEVVNSMFSNMGSKLFLQGFPVDDKAFFQDFVLVGEMLRALLYNSVNVDHPLYQALEDNREKLKDLTEKGDLVIMEDEDEDLFDDEEF